MIQNSSPNKPETETKMVEIELKDFTAGNTEKNEVTQYKLPCFPKNKA